jgi:hypothetical protein
MYDDEHEPEQPEDTVRIALDPEPDERGNVMVMAMLTHGRAVALTFNAN